jgi:hypothetical protein
MNDNHSSTEQSSTITRRKFTLTERLDADLQQLAAQHYQGNVSLCLRAAVEDHTNTLNGDGRIALQRLKREMGHLREAVAELDDDTTDIVAGIEAVNSRGTRDESLSVVDNRVSDTQQLIDTFREAKTPLRVEDIVEQVDLPLRRVIYATERLVDLGAIVETSSDARYQLITMQSSDTTNRYHEQPE